MQEITGNILFFFCNLGRTGFFLAWAVRCWLELKLFLQKAFNPVIFIQSMDHILEERTGGSLQGCVIDRGFPSLGRSGWSTDSALPLQSPGQGSAAETFHPETSEVSVALPSVSPLLLSGSWDRSSSVMRKSKCLLCSFLWLAGAQSCDSALGSPFPALIKLLHAPFPDMNTGHRLTAPCSHFSWAFSC